MSRVPSIYQHILHHLNPDGPGLLPGGKALPDDGFVPAGRRLPPGAADGMSGQRIPLGQSNPSVTPVLEALIELSRRPSARTRRRLEKAMRTRPCIELIDPLLEAIRTDPRMDAVALYPEVRRLLVDTHWREVVKLCIGILGLYQQEEDTYLFEVLGRHEEFTLFASVALGNTLRDPVPAWLRLVQHVQGWGKVHLVGRLCKHADRPQVRYWLLRFGCANTVDENLLAHQIATSCRLHEALAEPDPDTALLEGARHIISGLLQLGPAPGMEAYEHGAQACLLWIRAMEDRAARLQEFLTISDLLQWLNRPDHDWPEEIRTEIRSRAESVLRREKWIWLAEERLLHTDPDEAWAARETARRLNLPVFDRLLPALKENPGDTALWTYLAARASEAEMERLISLSQEADEEAVRSLLRALRRFEGVGTSLILRRLRSPQAADRMLALDVLGRWPVAKVSPEVALTVMSLAREDPEGVVRKSARGVLKGWKMPGPA